MLNDCCVGFRLYRVYDNLGNCVYVCVFNRDHVCVLKRDINLGLRRACVRPREQLSVTNWQPVECVCKFIQKERKNGSKTLHLDGLDVCVCVSVCEVAFAWSQILFRIAERHEIVVYIGCICVCVVPCLVWCSGFNNLSNFSM